MAYSQPVLPWKPGGDERQRLKAPGAVCRRHGIEFGDEVFSGVIVLESITGLGGVPMTMAV